MTVPPVRAIFWDIGGVLASNGWDRDQRAQVVQRFGLDATDFQERHKLIVSELELGRLTLDAYLDQTVFFRPRPFTRADFVTAMLEQSEPHPETLAYARSLAGRWRMYSLNNEGRTLNDHRIRQLQLHEFLLGFYSSCYLGIMKPNPSIYRLALDLAGVDADEAVMIDDRAQNVEAARSVGMHAVQYQNLPQLQQALEALEVR
ncbi:HAD family phosphatase [Deinococcus sonorensis]|uniref:HAD family phosphatase n=2 Tax=Deinococcus sonorensis TaxID=309891 RepID=A0AAU7U9U5_9DEIO